MRIERKVHLFILFIVCSLGFSAFAQSLADPENDPALRRALAQKEWTRLSALSQGLTERYVTTAALNSACGNGDFESGIAAAEWSGGHGSVDSAGDPNFGSFTAGIFPGALTDANAHQTSVGPGTDPTTGIGLAAPSGGSTKSARIGNAVNGADSELLSKTFTVTPATSLIRFWYAVVLEDPQHLPHEQPSFWVRVLDSSGAVIPGAANLGNGSDKVVADRNNPFFKVLSGGSIVYRDWSCAQIDLSKHIGETVTVQFVTEDCTLGGHYGYAYVDNFCGLCDSIDNSGSISYDASGSTTCGNGKLCFNYTLPTAGTQTGEITIKLDILQNNVLITTLTSPVLTSGTNYCFAINPASISGLAPGTFDWVATASFKIGTTPLAPKSVSTVVDHIPPYKTTCVTGCCPGPNLIANGDFEAGNTGFTSNYTAATGTAVLPGQYAVVNSTQAAAASSTWNARNHAPCTTTGKFLAVNGTTGQTGSKTIWSQTVPVVPGREYRFCANFRNLPQCGFDVKPKIDLKFSSPPNSTASTVISTNSSDPCNWVQETRSILIPAGVVLLTAEIAIDESAAGDGNDLAVDDISLQEMSPADPKYTLLDIASSNLTVTDYHITATPLNGQPYGYYWEVCETDIAGNCIAGTQVVNPSQWFVAGANNFPGYQGTSTLLPLASGPGVFKVSKKYKIRYGVFDLCTSFTSSTWYFGFSLSAKRVVVANTIEDLE